MKVCLNLIHFFEKYIQDKSNDLANKLYTYQNNYYQSYHINNKKNVEQFKNKKKII